MKIAKIDSYGIYFDNGSKIEFSYDLCCCEHNYAEFEYLALDTRKHGTHYRRYALVMCPYCGKEYEMLAQNVKKAKSCGCATFLKAKL